MSRLILKRVSLAAFVLLVSGLLVYQVALQPRLAASQAALTDIHAVSDLRARFNQDEGQTRLVLLISPT